MKDDKKMERRRQWAHDALTKAGLEECDSADKHGFSSYCIGKGESDWTVDDFTNNWYKDRVRIRVSDHYANPDRFLGGKRYRGFSVDIGDPNAAQEQIAEQVRMALQERNDYLLSDAFKEFVKEEAELDGLDFDEEDWL